MIQLDFSMDEYYAPAFEGELVGVIVCIVAILFILYEVIKSLRITMAARNSSKFDALFEILFHLLSVAYVVAFFFTIIWPTFRYSMYLPFETEEHAIVEQGTITNISPVPYSPKFNIDSEKKPYFASYVKIEETQYYFLTADGLTPGMSVEFSYLPRSRMVLCCRTVEENSRTGDGLREPS